ncbi:hypothetical protein O181_072666 [Austropuccinia psidii MF-1]|uniref:Reverse transcriptase Ty1/copia-type domain-containing protein n=1 Tax=Austropuccinia psidii MF-1 TaxID=1389203 RepID=A0A9Q3F348_9BASI|nr:hypothetical protein [Austropuccinia psidii MF-1]
MKAFTFEPYSDAPRVLYSSTGRIRVTHNYAQLKSKTTVTLCKYPSSLPWISNLPQPQVASLPVLKSQSLTVNSSNSGFSQSNEEPSRTNNPISETSNQSVRPKPRYDYVPYYDTAPQEVSSEALTNQDEEKFWKMAMKQEYDSLINHNTGELVPYPTDGSKVIGEMWRLTQKQNEFGEVYRHKARWVVLGNHQEHMLHYYDTWESVGRNKSFKVMLVLVVCQGYIPYQFDIETAFLHGEMDATVYVK